MNEHLEYGELVNQLYNINDGVSQYTAQLAIFIEQTKLVDLYPDLVSHCLPIACLRGISLQKLTQLAIDLIIVLREYNVKPDEYLVHFIYRQLVLNYDLVPNKDNTNG